MDGALQGRLDSLAEALMLADAADLQALAALHLEFGGLAGAWDGGHNEAAAAACAAAQALLERLVLGESKEPAGDLEKVSRAITWLQGLADGRAPAELGPAPGAAPAEAAGGRGPSAAGADEAAQADPALLADFVRESLDHLETSEASLMSLEAAPGNLEAVNAVFRAFHTIKGVAGFLGLASIQAFAHGTEDLLDRARQGLVILAGPVLDVVLESVDAMKKRIQWLAAGGGPYPEAEARAMDAVLARVRAALAGRVEDWKPTSPAPTPAPTLAPSPDGGPAPAAPPPAHGPAASGPAASPADAPAGEAGARREAGSPVKETVKVEADRLDRLLDAIGELVIAESMIFGSPELRGRISPLLAQQMAQLDKITRELQQMGTSLRMVPLRPVFQKMARLARDLSRKAGKEVELLCAGEETELDKTVVDKIGDPLVHMVRNAIDHGIEPDAAARLEAGKPARARVGLKAFQKGGSVCIEVSDDGKGLNREAILRKARERGLLEVDGASLPDGEVWAFIFEAGFSTAAKVTEISGRGVGMDVVKRNIESLRGRIEIDSRPGEGTTFRIWLPLTLAIIDGMIVRAGRERFVFPTLSILRIVPLRPEKIRTAQGRGEMLLLQDELVPILRLDGLLPGGLGGSSPRLAVILECGGRKAGLPVDELLGQHQVVIKGLGETFKHVPGLAGGAILPDGTVGIILDTDGLVKMLRAEPAPA